MAGRTPEPDDDHEPTPDAEDVDARFAEITASLGNLTLPPAPSDDGPTETPGAPAEDADTADPAAAPGPRDYVLAPESDEPGFEPPDPAIESNDPLVTLAWVGVVASVALVLVYLVLWRSMPGVLLALAGAAFVTSVAVLVARMPGRRDVDEPDDGAVV